MDDDFNTAGALGAVFSFVGTANTLLQTAPGKDALPTLEDASQTMIELLGVLGLVLDESEATQEDYPQELFNLAQEVAGYSAGDGQEALDALLEARATARKEKSFAVADSVRDGLSELGYVIEDTPQGSRVTRQA